MKGLTKKVLTIAASFLFISCSCLSFTGCVSYCDPRGKDWYNMCSLPSIDAPFNEIYDGCYYIKIDKDGNVLFKPLSGEEIKGKLYIERANTKARLTVEFENGVTSTGLCRKQDGERTMYINYGLNTYYFSGVRQYTKEAFDEYRRQFIEFLTEVYETGIFPTQEEIEANDLYKKFTNYYQIDPGCGGPIVYETVEWATINNVEIREIRSQIFEVEMSVSLENKSFVCVTDSITVVNIESGEIKELSIQDITEGECLVTHEVWWSSGEKDVVNRIFYFDKNI